MRVATIERQKASNQIDNLCLFIDNRQPLSKVKRERLCMKVYKVFAQKTNPQMDRIFRWKVLNENI